MIVRLITKDRILIQDRETEDNLFYINRSYTNHYNYDHEFIKYTLKKDAAEKGVRVISYTVHSGVIEAIVEWL